MILPSAQRRSAAPECNVRPWVVLLLLSLLGPATAADEVSLPPQLAPLLPRDWRPHAGASAVADVNALAQRYSTAAPRATPDVVQLRAIARTLESPAAPVPLWQRLRAWVVAWLQAGHASWPGWLHSWSPGPRFWRSFFYLVAGAVVSAAITVVVIEARAARGTARRRSGARTAAAVDGIVPQDPLPQFAAIEAATLREQPALVLRLLVGALIRSQRLDRDRNFTCRELVTQARFDSPAQQEQFLGFALLAEQALYGDGANTCSGNAGMAGADLAPVRQLYESLLLALPSRRHVPPS